MIKAGKIIGSYATLAAAKAAGAVTLNIGVFLNTIISFGIIAFSVFLIIKADQSVEEKRGGGAGYAYYEGLFLLFVGYSPKSLPLSSLHL